MFTLPIGIKWERLEPFFFVCLFAYLLRVNNVSYVNGNWLFWWDKYLSVRSVMKLSLSLSLSLSSENAFAFDDIKATTNITSKNGVRREVEKKKQEEGEIHSLSKAVNLKSTTNARVDLDLEDDASTAVAENRILRQQPTLQKVCSSILIHSYCYIYNLPRLSSSMWDM